MTSYLECFYVPWDQRGAPRLSYPSSCHIAAYAHLLQALLTPLLKLLVSMACRHCVCRDRLSCSNTPLYLVGTTESKGEMWRSAPLLSFPPRKAQNRSISVNLLSAQSSKGSGLSPPLSSLKTSYSTQRAPSSIFLRLSIPLCQSGPEPPAEGKHSSLASIENKCVASRWN